MTEPSRRSRHARRAAAAVLFTLGPVAFWYVLANRQIDELVDVAWFMHREVETPFWTDWSLWRTVADGAVQPAVYLAAAWACAGALLAPRAARWLGAALLAWTLFAALPSFPPLLDRPDFDPAPWAPFATVLAAGGVPALVLVLWPRRRAVGDGARPGPGVT